MAIERYSHLFFKEKLHLVGSASSALFIYLKHLGLTNKVVLCPSNICYSIPFTIRYSGNSPLFYDVDRETGNPSLESIQNNLFQNKDIAAIVIAHMFGNYAEQRDSITQLCHKNHIKVIDDCAASLGMNDVSGALRMESDAVIFSFGRKKHLDIGLGGLLATDDDIDIEYHERNISSDIANAHSKIETFDALYKAIFYSNYYFSLLPDLSYLSHFIESAFVFKVFWTEELKGRLFKKLETVKLNKRKSLALTGQLEARIAYKKTFFKKYHYCAGSHPWRFNIVCANPTVRNSIVSQMLEKKLNVSIWYPPIDALFGQEAKENARYFSDRILNFDFMHATDRQVNEFVGIINSFEGH